MEDTDEWVLRRHGGWQDPIVAEVRAVRSALFAASGNDIREFCRRAREQQAASGHVILMRASEPDREPTQADPASPPSPKAGCRS